MELDPDVITPVEEGLNPTFFVGSSISLVAPHSSDNLYLFLGENDGIFADNPIHYAYTVNITPDAAGSGPTVPAPTALFLATSGLVWIPRLRRRFSSFV